MKPSSHLMESDDKVDMERTPMECFFNLSPLYTLHYLQPKLTAFGHTIKTQFPRSPCCGKQTSAYIVDSNSNTQLNLMNVGWLMQHFMQITLLFETYNDDFNILICIRMFYKPGYKEYVYNMVSFFLSEGQEMY